jgi:hypothetical protein
LLFATQRRHRGPDGVLLAGPLFGETGILYAELDVAAACSRRRELDGGTVPTT